MLTTCVGDLSTLLRVLGRLVGADRRTAGPRQCLGQLTHTAPASSTCNHTLLLAPPIIPPPPNAGCSSSVHKSRHAPLPQPPAWGWTGAGCGQGYRGCKARICFTDDPSCPCPPLCPHCPPPLAAPPTTTTRTHPKHHAGARQACWHRERAAGRGHWRGCGRGAAGDPACVCAHGPHAGCDGAGAARRAARGGQVLAPSAVARKCECCRGGPGCTLVLPSSHGAIEQQGR